MSSLLRLSFQFLHFVYKSIPLLCEAGNLCNSACWIATGFNVVDVSAKLFWQAVDLFSRKGKAIIKPNSIPTASRGLRRFFWRLEFRLNGVDRALQIAFRRCHLLVIAS